MTLSEKMRYCAYPIKIAWLGGRRAGRSVRLRAGTAGCAFVCVVFCVSYVSSVAVKSSLSMEPITALAATVGVIAPAITFLSMSSLHFVSSAFCEILFCRYSAVIARTH